MARAEHRTHILLGKDRARLSEWDNVETTVDDEITISRTLGGLVWSDVQWINTPQYQGAGQQFKGEEKVVS